MFQRGRKLATCFREGEGLSHVPEREKVGHMFQRGRKMSHMFQRLGKVSHMFQRGRRLVTFSRKGKG